MNLAISRILVPVDFSRHSEAALHYAMALASGLGASVDLLHVVEDPVAAGAWSGELSIQNVSDLRRNLIEDAERRLEGLRANAQEPKVPWLLMVRMGQPADVIDEYARAFGVDLIVMGTHGRGGLAHLFMGSVAERVVRHAPCPVLTLSDAAIRDTPDQATGLGAVLGHLGTSRE